MPDEFEVPVAKQMIDVGPGAAEEIIDTDYVCAGCGQPIAEMRAQKSSSICDQNSLLNVHGHLNCRPILARHYSKIIGIRLDKVRPLAFHVKDNKAGHFS